MDKAAGGKNQEGGEGGGRVRGRGSEGGGEWKDGEEERQREGDIVRDCRGKWRGKGWVGGGLGWGQKKN